MKDSEYPALFRLADKAAKQSQLIFFCCNIIFLGSLLFSSVVTTAAVQADSQVRFGYVGFIVSILVSLLMVFMRFDKTWYNTRAIAESVKTVTWRYMMRAQPFDVVDNGNADEVFTKNLMHIVNENRLASQSLVGGELSGKTITDEMRSLRDMPIEARGDTYLESRVIDQKNYYSKKSVINNNGYVVFSILMVAIQIYAFVLYTTCLSNKMELLPSIQVAITITSVLLCWIQLKRYSDLSTSYSLAAIEIGIIESRYPRRLSDTTLSSYVLDSENAFSREHTQWVAKRSS